MSSLDPDLYAFVYGRDPVAIRRTAKYQNHERELLLERRNAAVERIVEVDGLLSGLAGERCSLLAEIGQLVEQLFPRCSDHRGRRRRRAPEPRLPPLAEGAVLVWGRELRELCVAVMRQHDGPMTLRELHTALHRRGFGIAHERPAHTLANAAWLEARAGRLRRVGRGRYTAASPTAAHRATGNEAVPEW